MLGALLAGCASASTPVEQLLADNERALHPRDVEAGVVMYCSPPDAEVLLDGVLQGRCRDLEGQLLRMDEGGHRVQVNKPGTRPYEARVAAGMARTVLRVQLEPTNQGP